MRTLGGLALALLCGGAGLAQHHGSIQPFVSGGFGSVVYPAGTAATNPGLTRITPNVVYPGGGGPRLVVPNATGAIRRVPRQANGTGSFVYAYPVYVGSYGTSFDAGAAYDSGVPPAQQQQSGVTVVMPPQQPPVIINQYYDTPAHPQMITTPPDNNDNGAPAPVVQIEPTHYFLAFKDHTIYSAIAYWVDGDTLHYFTAGNTHNQVSLSLIDREMTERLNKDTGAEVKLPAAK